MRAGLLETRASLTLSLDFGHYFEAAPGEDVWEWIRQQPDFHRLVLGPGEYYPRIARPLALSRENALWSPNVSTDKAYVAIARSQLVSLMRKLETICQTVHPSKKTLDVYGHEIRNLLILAATEAEMHWRGILIANGQAARQFKSFDYVKLVDPLKLQDYAITFRDFPELPPVRPFADWSKICPTRSLQWYDAYNAVKHNREGEFDRGTLCLAFEAVSACIVLLTAQFGKTAMNAELFSVVDLIVPDSAS